MFGLSEHLARRRFLFFVRYGGFQRTLWTMSFHYVLPYLGRMLGHRPFFAAGACCLLLYMESLRWHFRRGRFLFVVLYGKVWMPWEILTFLCSLLYIEPEVMPQVTKWPAYFCRSENILESTIWLVTIFVYHNSCITTCRSGKIQGECSRKNASALPFITLDNGFPYEL